MKAIWAWLEFLLATGLLLALLTAPVWAANDLIGRSPAAKLARSQSH